MPLSGGVAVPNDLRKGGGRKKERATNLESEKQNVITT